MVEVTSSDERKIQVKSFISDAQVTAGTEEDGGKMGVSQVACSLPPTLPHPGCVGMALLPDCLTLNSFRPLVSEAQLPFH